MRVGVRGEQAVVHPLTGHILMLRIWARQQISHEFNPYNN